MKYVIQKIDSEHVNLLRIIGEKLYGKPLEYSSDPLILMDQFRVSQLLSNSDVDQFLEKTQMYSSHQLQKRDFPQTIGIDHIGFHYYLFNDLYFNADMLDNFRKIRKKCEYFYASQSPLMIKSADFTFLLAPYNFQYIEKPRIIEINRKEYQDLKKKTFAELQARRLKEKGIDTSNKRIYFSKDKIIYELKK